MARWFCKRPKDERYISLAGCYNAGKKTLVQKLTDGTFPTFGIQRTELKEGNFLVWDWEVGGRCLLRPLMYHFCKTVDVVIMVIDSQDRNAFEWGAIRHKVQEYLDEEELQDFHLIILANKQDLPGAMTCQEMRDLLALSEDQDQRVEIIATSLVTGQGLPEVRDWIDRQHARRQLQKAAVQPLKKAVPPTLKSAFSRMSSALKQAFGLAKNKLPPVA